MGKDQELLQAIRNNDVSAVKKLLSKFKAKSKKSHKKHNLHIVDGDGFTPLHHAALGGNGEIVMSLLDIVHDVNIKDKKGMTPLHLAAWAGQVEPALLLLDAGAQTNLCSRNGSTPLHLASEHGNYVVVERLVDHDCDPTVVTNQGETALDLACRFGHLEVVRILLYNTKGKCDRLLNPKEFQEKDSPLHMAAKTGHFSVVKILVEAGADVNQKGPTGSCLHEAALYGKTDVVKYLIEAGIDVNIKNREGLTALDVVSKFTKTGVSSEIKNLLREASLEVVYAKAIRDYCNIKDPSFLTLHLGDIVLVLERHKDGMWKGCIRDDQKERIGFFPASAVKVLRSPSTRNSVRTSTSSNDGPIKVTSMAPVTATFEIVTVASPAQPIAGKSRAPRMSSFRKKASTRSESGDRRPVPSENSTDSLLRRPQSSDLDDRNKRKLNYLDIMLVEKPTDHSDGGRTGPMSAPPTKTEYADIWMLQAPAKDGVDGAPRDRLTNGHARDVAKQPAHDEHAAQIISQQRQQQVQKQVKFQQHLQQQLQTQLQNQQASNRSPLKPVASCPPLPMKARHYTISGTRTSTSDEVPPLPLKKRQSFSGRTTSPTSPEQPALPPKLEKKLRSSLRGDRRGTSPPPPPPPPPAVSSTPSPVPSRTSSLVSENSPRTSNPSPPITIANSNRLTVEAKWCPVLTPSPPPTAPQPIVQSSSPTRDYPTPPPSVSSSSLPSTPQSSPVHTSGDGGNSPQPTSSPTLHPPGSPPLVSAKPLHPGSPSSPPSSPPPPPTPPPPPPITPPPLPSPPPNTFPSPCQLPPPLMSSPERVTHPRSPPASPPPPPPISPPLSAFKTPPSSPRPSSPPPTISVSPLPSPPSQSWAAPTGTPPSPPALQFVVSAPQSQSSETVSDYAIHRPVIGAEKCPVTSNAQGTTSADSEPELIPVQDTRLRAPADVISRAGYEDMDRLIRTWTNPLDRPRIPENTPGYVLVNPVAKPMPKKMQSSGDTSNTYENFVPLKANLDGDGQRSPAEPESPPPSSADKPDKPDRHRYVNCGVTKEMTQPHRTTVIPVLATQLKSSTDNKNLGYNDMYDWLAQSKLLTYIDNFAEAGFDMTAVVGLTSEDLSDIQITKTGHRKRLLSEASKLSMPNLSSQSDVPSWLASLDLSQYENHFIDGGFDDIEFLYDLTREDLLAIGITKIGHQRKILMAAKRLQQRDVPDGVTSPDEREEHGCFVDSNDVMASPGDELLRSAAAEQNVGDTAVAGVSDYTEIKACNTELGACTTAATSENVVEYLTQDNTTDASHLRTDESAVCCVNKSTMNGVASEDSPDGVRELPASFQHTKKAKPPPVKPKSYKKPPPTVAPKPKPKCATTPQDVNTSVDFTSVIKEAEAISSQDSGSEASPPGTLARQHHAGSMGSLEGSLHTNTSGSQGSLNSESEDFQRGIKESFVKKEPVPSPAPKPTLKPALANHLTLSQEDLLEMQRREEELKNMQSENDKSDSLFTDIQGMLDNLNSEIDDMFK